MASDQTGSHRCLCRLTIRRYDRNKITIVVVSRTRTTRKDNYKSSLGRSLTLYFIFFELFHFIQA